MGLRGMMQHKAMPRHQLVTAMLVPRELSFTPVAIRNIWLLTFLRKNFLEAVKESRKYSILEKEK
jgi:hypothetical protein